MGRKPPREVPREPLRRRWTRDELRTLTMGVGAFSLDYIARKTHRTVPAVYGKITEFLGGGGVGRGTRTVAVVAEETGYTPRQIHRAGRALGQRWQRTSTRGAYMLGDDQVDAIMLWLRHDYWCSRSHTYACVDCGRTDEPPYGLGLCGVCYRARRRAFLEADLPFSLEALRGLVVGLRATYPQTAAAEWLHAFEASLTARCVLTRGALDRLHAECTAKGIKSAHRESDSSAGEVRARARGVRQAVDRR